MEALMASVAMAILLTLAPKVLGWIGTFAVHTFFNAVTVREQDQCAMMDHHIGKYGLWCSNRQSGVSALPGNGLHVAWLRGLVIAHKADFDSPRGGVIRLYTLYTLCCSRKAVATLLTGNANDVTHSYIYAPSPWRTSTTTMRCPPPGPARKWQSRAVQQIITQYDEGDHCASILVTGKPGSGKSTLAELVASALMKRGGIDPSVVMNFDLMAKGLLLEDAFAAAPTSTTPIVLLLDEFDSAINFAEDTKRLAASGGAGDARCLADSPVSLLQLLDRLARWRHVIVIFTSNRSDMRSTHTIYARYTRLGRVHLHITV